MLWLLAKAGSILGRCVRCDTQICVCVCWQAIWYTEEQGVEGPVFGSSDKWKGLAVFFDSFDNDNQVGPLEQPAMEVICGTVISHLWCSEWPNIYCCVELTCSSKYSSQELSWPCPVSKMIDFPSNCYPPAFHAWKKLMQEVVNNWLNQLIAFCVQHNNPYIMAMTNDGTKSYDHKS